MNIPQNSTSAVVLIVDDQPDNLDILVNYLSDSGLELMVATDGEQALSLAFERTPDIVLLDVMMPGLNGYQVCAELKANKKTEQSPVIFMSALADIDKRLEGFKAGAIDFVIKPLQREEVLARIKAHLTIRHQQQMLMEKNRLLERLNTELQEQISKRKQAEQALNLADERLSTITRREAEHWKIDAFVGQSLATRELIEEVRNLQAAPKTNVLVLGESGTGKELISRAIHYGSARSNKPFVAVNCSAIPAELADAELFGHTKGAYTGATTDRSGYFVQADGGTLFLDEIGDMPLSLQAKLLRVLEDGLVTPIGGRQSRKVDVRVIAATNLDLRSKLQTKEFRQDLFFRLAGYQVSLPPLRERQGDIELLAEHFLVLLGEQMGREQPEISPQALSAIGRYHFPGNVRELKNLIEYALIASRGQMITERHLHFMEEPRQSLAGENSVSGAESDVDLAQEQVEDASIQTSESVNWKHLKANSQENLIIEYAKTHGKIDNTIAQQVLEVDHSRASYLLKKLHKEGLLNKQGQRRWTYYTVAAH
ncbi:sigma-54-dependent transcriptional regulator [Aliikangiella coralliicola]|uniref:Sigma-54-dependent Fis family transcriptional regulator n=1 Tax=Aliikangiella coralliicola TaxID=2592383 RepID=A0A545UF54_9GAMM|nr:sigma-54 dependent transcriptional regulator [Aliikangiella coralliicola]TQV88075.1 sigma-54-dependent Fis family transcriptional regulator [Aliikangiella coralliicola]